MERGFAISMTQEADCCLIIEGAYPYVVGGLSNWSHQFIKWHPEYNFHLLCILAPGSLPKSKYEIPKNVVGIEHIELNNLPHKTSHMLPRKAKQFLEAFSTLFLKLHEGSLLDLKKILDLFELYPEARDAHVLLDSQYTWHVLVDIYQQFMPNKSFINFFWSFRSMARAFYSVILPPLPKARLYHALCTGYAGLLLARARVETDYPCLLTEHGIYTNERRIEVLSSEWLYEQQTLSYNIEQESHELKDYWLDAFFSYSKLTYNAADKIITLFEENQEFQLADGADPHKLLVISNSIDVDSYANIPRDTNHPPTIALVGRVVPIKDVKTFIRCVQTLKTQIPSLLALVIGPTEEDPEYYKECLDMVGKLDLTNTLAFTGRVDSVKSYLGKIDLVVLSSISEAQPLIILEAGANGIPCVATNVGACRELIYGRKNERPRLLPGGRICPLANPTEMAKDIYQLLTDKRLYSQCSEAAKERVKKYYYQDLQKNSYQELYESLWNQYGRHTVGVT